MISVISKDCFYCKYFPDFNSVQNLSFFRKDALVISDTNTVFTCSYLEQDPDVLPKLKLIPLVIAGWLRYLLAVDDNGNAFEISPDPMAEHFQNELKAQGISYKMDVSVSGKLSGILSNETVFGLDINKTGLTPVIEKYLDELIKENGAVRKTLHSAVAN
jgi:fructuronate reductase